MARSAKQKGGDETVITPVELKQGQVTFHIIGKTPLIYNSMSLHVMKQLLVPPRKKTAAEKITQLKHEPYEEYRRSVYRRRDDENGPTRLVAPSRWFKKATAEVAKRIPGATSTEVRQLVWVEGDYVDLYGTPQIFMSLVRQADMNKTPDVRTRAYVSRWYCAVRMTYVQPQISVGALAGLVSAAGVLNGVGDYRQEKGGSNFGQFELVDENDPRIAILKREALKAQDEALKNPSCVDEQTEQLLAFYDSEIASRELSGNKSKKKGQDEIEAHA